MALFVIVEKAFLIHHKGLHQVLGEKKKREKEEQRGHKAK